MTEQEPLSIYLDDPYPNTWVWLYQDKKDEWWFFADDYEPDPSVKMIRWHELPLPLVVHGTTMPRGVRDVIVRSGLMLFEKSNAGISQIALDKAVVIKITDELMAIIEWMKTR